MTGTGRRTGHCLCGNVRYAIVGDLTPITVCHCKQCQRWSGDRFPATRVSIDRIEIQDQHNSLKWFRSGETSQRGFCCHCGSSMFFKNETENYIAAMAGTLDDTSNIKIETHIYVADRSGFDDLPEGVGFLQDQPPGTKKY